MAAVDISDVAESPRENTESNEAVTTAEADIPSEDIESNAMPDSMENSKDGQMESDGTKEISEDVPAHAGSLTVENVTRLYVTEGRDMATTAKKLNVNMSVLKSFIIHNRIFKNREQQKIYDARILSEGCINYQI